MISFFRKIRQSTLLESKFSKYLLYAIGEIVLVVIGILIALQINMWNEGRKERNVEVKLLEEIKSNLQSTLENFTRDTIYNANTVRYYRLIYNYVELDLPYNNELDSAFAALPLFSSPYTTNSGYKTLQNKGLDLIKNKALKAEIVALYDVESISLLVDIDKAEWSLNDNVVVPFFAKHVRRIDGASLNTARPNDFESLKQNQEFVNILQMLIRQRRKGIEFYKSTMLLNKKLIALIDQELASRAD